MNQFDMAQENVAGNWYSSMILLVVALLSLLCYQIDHNRFKDRFLKFLNFGWLLLFLVFFTLSFDEVGSFHERIGDSPLFKSLGDGWVIFYILVGLVGVFMIVFCWNRFRHIRWAFVFGVIGAILFLSNPFQENYEIKSMRAAPDPSTWIRPVKYILLEEGSEIFASFCFIVALVLYIIRFSDNSDPENFRKTRAIQIHKYKIFYFSIGVVLLLFILMGLVTIFPGKIKDEGDGIPANWFPSALAFITASISYYIYTLKGSESGRKVYFVLALLSLLMSMYYGSNMFISQISVKAHYIQPITTAIVCITSVICILALMPDQKSIWGKIGIILWMILFILSLTWGRGQGAGFGLVAYCALFFSILLREIKIKGFEKEKSSIFITSST